MGPSVRLIRLFGIPIEVNFSWVFIFLLVVVMLGVQFGDYPEWSAVHRWALAVGIALLFFMSVVAHELSHSLLALNRGIPVTRITLFLFGGVSQLSHEARRPFTEFAVTVVGPVSSLALALALFGLWYAFKDVNATAEVVLRLLMSVNLMLGVFNLLPGFPLDGGRLLRAAAWGVTGNYWLATQIAARMGQATGALMAACGATVAFLDFGQFGVVGIWLALIGAFLFGAATMSYRQERDRERLRRHRVTEVMTADWVTLPGEMLSTSLLAWHGLARGNGMAMVAVDGRLAGFLTMERLADSIGDAGDPAPLSSVMQPLDAISRLDHEDTISDAIEQIEEGSYQAGYPVFQDGVLVGLAGRDDIVLLARQALERGKRQRKSRALC